MMPLIVLAVLGIAGLMLLSWLRATRDARGDQDKKLPSDLSRPKP